ncbi:hypothetical protein MKZ38_010038 [Zalerion maritima]|uniref:Rho1 guanine nucleotide exchange factor 1 n=1 Tax=Zalerion maritima TaxID=339359 RepID=A0AAD5RUG6_9PEZI|nr:hypothetical protein MKZ38_010038 [Zalerion maritima]
MADPYGQRGGPQYGRMPPQRPAPGGREYPGQRDAAFSNIFGAAPPPGRSQTMTSSSAPSPGMFDSGRTQTMSSMSSMQRQPPPRVPQGGGGGYDDRQRGPQQQPRPRPQMDPNGYYQGQGQRHASAGQHYPSMTSQSSYQSYQPGQQRRPPPQQQEPQQRPERHPYPGAPTQPAAPRFDSRGGMSQRGHGPGQAQSQRYYPGGQGGPALNSDPYRSQSLASVPRPQIYQPPPNSFQPPGRDGFRHPPNAAQHGSAGTTAQGRVVPMRPDERSMSLTGYHTQDRVPHQTVSGRVIPNRRAPSGSGNVDLTSMSGYPGYGAPGAQTRTTSMVSSTVGGGQDSTRTMSLASTVAPSINAPDGESNGMVHRASISRSIDSTTTERPPTARRRSPVVNPAYISKVAECFRRKIVVGDRMKNGLTYKSAFSGSEAVDVLSYIIRTTDRNLALLLGRALDAQKFFHDVTYEHRLRDSPNEMYQFRETLMEEMEENEPPVNGVFTLLSECYSPTCTRDQLCYSIACPRRLEQVSRLNLKSPPVGLKSEQAAAVGDDDVAITDEQKLWINTVSKEVVESVDDKERKRQEVISEICYTERDFVKDLEYLRDFWINPLRKQASPIPQNRRDKVVRNIFGNIIDHPSIHLVSSRFAKALTERQQKNPVVKNLGDIFLQYVPDFEPFILYGAKQMEGKFEFENERSINPFFSKFVDEIERRKESRKLELNGYLTKPTTRLARYPLLLDNVLKYTEAGNPDKEDIPKVLVMIRELLSRVNAESGKAENRFNLRRLNEQLRFRPNERVDLRLTEDGRELVFKSLLKKTPSDPTEITAYLFDHAVLLVRIKQQGKMEEVKAYRRPIPLELLSIKEMEEVIPGSGMKRSSSSLLPALRTNATETKKGDGWPITFRHLGKAGYELTLYASNQAARQKWLEYIDSAQKRLRSRADFFDTSILTAGFFTSTNKVQCVTPFDGGRKLIYGTSNGIFVSDRKVKDQKPRRVIDAADVSQIDVLEEYSLLLVLTNKTLVSYSLNSLDPNEQTLAKRPKKIQSHCTFFKTGICLGRHLVCAVKPSALSSTLKVYEPTDAMSKKGKPKGLNKMFGTSHDELKPFKEFYIPGEASSVHFLKSKLCVACARGFEVVSLETLETQALLDQADTSLDFVARKEGAKPIHIERLNGEFLLNYSEFSFFVNRNGWRARPQWRLDWEGSPTNFALSYPWILAFEPNFIELRHIDTGAVHIVPHKNIRMLHSSTHEILFAHEDERGEDMIEAIDFWKHQRESKLMMTPLEKGQYANADLAQAQQIQQVYPQAR